MFRNELGKEGMAHRVDNLDDVSINYIMYTSHYGTLVAMTSGDYRCRFEGKFKTLISLPSGHGIELGFFSQLQNYRPHPRETELAKMGQWRIFEK